MITAFDIISKGSNAVVMKKKSNVRFQFSRTLSLFQFIPLVHDIHKVMIRVVAIEFPSRVSM